MKLKKFNLEIALKDPSQVVRGDGTKVIHISKRVNHITYPLAVCFEDIDGNLEVSSYTEEGVYSIGYPHDIDNNLFLKPKETTYWYNIYKNDTTGRIWVADCYLSNIDAFDEIPSKPLSTFIKTQSFTIEE
jgi:hypothetical protein